jgi:hypothetical protein
VDPDPDSDPDLQHCLKEQRVGIRGLPVLEQLQHVVDRHWSLTRKIATQLLKNQQKKLKLLSKGSAADPGSGALLTP